MKRILAALSLAALAAPAAAASYGAPFEQTQLDRQLPDIVVKTSGTPLQDDNLRFAAVGGSTVSDRSIAYERGMEKSPWANDHNFIAPAP